MEGPATGGNVRYPIANRGQSALNAIPSVKQSQGGRSGDLVAAGFTANLVIAVLQFYVKCLTLLNAMDVRKISHPLNSPPLVLRTTDRPTKGSTAVERVKILHGGNAQI